MPIINIGVSDCVSIIRIRDFPSDSKIVTVKISIESIEHLKKTITDAKHHIGYIVTFMDSNLYTLTLNI